MSKMNYYGGYSYPGDRIYEEAQSSIEEIQELISRGKESYEDLYTLSLNFLTQKEWERVINVVSHLFGRAPVMSGKLTSLFLNSRGFAYLERFDQNQKGTRHITDRSMADLGSAIGDLVESLKIDPDNKSARRNLESAMTRLSRLQDKISEFLKPEVFVVLG